MKCTKLVRDGIRARHDGNQHELFCQPEVLAALLVGKIYEEVAEVARDMENVEEYADVLTALEALAKLNGITPAQIRSAGRRKLADKGGFDEGRVIYGVWR